VKVHVLEHKFLILAPSREELIYHHMLGHLNFRDMKKLSKEGIVWEFPFLRKCHANNCPYDTY
jgi:hypothetical protein